MAALNRGYPALGQELNCLAHRPGSDAIMFSILSLPNTHQCGHSESDIASSMRPLPLGCSAGITLQVLNWATNIHLMCLAQTWALEKPPLLFLLPKIYFQFLGQQVVKKRKKDSEHCLSRLILLVLCISLHPSWLICPHLSTAFFKVPRLGKLIWTEVWHGIEHQKIALGQILLHCADMSACWKLQPLRMKPNQNVASPEFCGARVNFPFPLERVC